MAALKILFGLSSNESKVPVKGEKSVNEIQNNGEGSTEIKKSTGVDNDHFEQHTHYCSEVLL